MYNSEKTAQVRPYFKHVLAELYGISRPTLSEWIKRNRLVSEELKHAGYTDSQKQFTQLEIEIIFKHLDTPGAVEPYIQRTDERVSLKSYSISELAYLYYWDVRTLKSFLQKKLRKTDYTSVFSVKYDDEFYVINSNKRIFSTNEVKIIFETLGHPYKRVKIMSKKGIL